MLLGGYTALKRQGLKVDLLLIAPNYHDVSKLKPIVCHNT